MREYAEPRLRRLVAEHLGVDPEELRPEVSLIDELAVDSLELIELALALEGELGIDIPERTIDEIRTYGDLAGAALALARGSQDLEAAVGSAPATVRSRVVSGVGAALERAGTLTPYLVEEIAEDALAAGRAARLELTVPADTDDTGVAWLRGQFTGLGTRGVEVVQDLCGGLIAPGRIFFQAAHDDARQVVGHLRVEQLRTSGRLLGALVHHLEH